MKIYFIVLLGIMEGLLLSQNGTTGPKIFLNFSYYHFFLAAFFVLFAYSNKLKQWRWYSFLPALILTQDFFSHLTTWLIDCGAFFSTWSLWPLHTTFLMMPLFYWILILAQIILIMKDIERINK